MAALRALPSESLPVVNLACAPPGLHCGSGDDPKVILLVTFVNWARKNCDAGRTDRHVGRNSDVDVVAILK